MKGRERERGKGDGIRGSERCRRRRRFGRFEQMLEVFGRSENGVRVRVEVCISFLNKSTSVRCIRTVHCELFTCHQSPAFAMSVHAVYAIDVYFIRNIFIRLQAWSMYNIEKFGKDEEFNASYRVLTSAVNKGMDFNTTTPYDCSQDESLYDPL